MIFDSMFLVTIQSSLILGLIHGINPCGHSWLIVAPFVTGQRDGKKVFMLTASFLLGTTLACLLTGMTLGAVSMLIPESMTFWVDCITATIIILLGLILIIKPDILHHHDHDHGHHNDHEKIHPISSCSCNHSHEPHNKTQELKGFLESLRGKISVPAMFVIGFINMIIPCPTVAIMYKYAVDSGSYLKSTMVFGVYAVATAIAVGGVIFAIYKTTNAMYMFQKGWIESAVMRTAGVLTLVFGIWTII